MAETTAELLSRYELWLRRRIQPGRITDAEIQLASIAAADHKWLAALPMETLLILFPQITKMKGAP